MPRVRVKTHHGWDKRHKAGDVIEVTDAEYEAFSFKFELLEEEPTGPPDATRGALELAEQHGVDLSSVRGSGPDGRIYKADVEAVIGDATG